MRAVLLVPFVLAAAWPAWGQEMSKSAPEVTPAIEAQAKTTVQTLRDANNLLANGDTNGALAKVDKALTSDPRSFAGLIMRGAIYSKLKQWDSAFNDYEAAHLIDPHHPVPLFNLAEISFVQKDYAKAKPNFMALTGSSELGDLAVYKVFLCDLLAGHEDVAAKELAAINDVGSDPSYYFSNAAWDLYHHKVEDARGWLLSANNIYPEQKNGFYASSLFDIGYLPLPPPPQMTK